MEEKMIKDATYEVDKKKIQKKLSCSVQELCDASEIYKYIYPIIRMRPNLIYMELLSRLQSRSEYVKKFIESSRIQLLNKATVKTETKRHLFLIDKALIVQLHDQLNGPFIFLHVHDVELLCSIYVINSLNGTLIGYQNTGLQVFEEGNIQIITKEENKSRTINKLSDLGATVYIHAFQSIYLSNFIVIHRLINDLKGVFKKLFILNSNNLLVVMDKSMLHFNNIDVKRKEMVKIKSEVEFEDEIELIESTMSEGTIYSSEYLNQLDSITLIVGFKLSKIIKIYRFVNDENENIQLITQIDSIKWDYYGFYERTFLHNFKRWRHSCVIESKFMIDSMNIEKFEAKRSSVSTGSTGSTVRMRILNLLKRAGAWLSLLRQNFDDALIRFCLQEENFIKVIEIKNDGRYTITEIDRLNIGLELARNETVLLESFIDNKIFALTRDKYFYRSLYVFDLKEMKVTIRKQGHIHLIDQNGLFIERSLIDECEYFDFYKIDENKLNEISRNNIKYVYSKPFENKYIKGDIRLKNGKLIAVEPERRQSVVEINYLMKTGDMNEINENSYFKIDSIHCVLDNEHVLATIRRQHEIEWAIVNVVNQDIVKSLCVDTHGIGCNREYLILVNEKTRCLCVYYINKEQGFILLYEEFLEEEIDQSSDSNTCYFDPSDINKFAIILFYDEIDSIKIKFMDVLIEANGNREVKLNREVLFKIDDIQLQPMDMICQMTPLNNYLVLHENELDRQVDSASIYYIDIHKSEVVNTVEMDHNMRWNDVKCLPNSDDLIVKSNKSLYYVYFDRNSEKKIKLNEYETDDFCFEIKSDFLFVLDGVCFKYAPSNLGYMEVYKIDDLKRDFKLGNCLFRLEKVVTKVSVSVDYKYLALATNHCELILYNLNELDKQLAYLQLPFETKKILMSDEYISIVCSDDYRLVSFKVKLQ